VATVLHIDGVSGESFTGTIEAGTSLRELMQRLGGTVREEHVPDPTPLQQEAKRTQEVGEEVSALLRTCKRWADVPAPEHLPRPDDNCVTCDARRIAAGMLD
jgi:hypothetical protein